MLSVSSKWLVVGAGWRDWLGRPCLKYLLHCNMLSWTLNSTLLVVCQCSQWGLFLASDLLSPLHCICKQYTQSSYEAKRCLKDDRQRFLQQVSKKQFRTLSQRKHMWVAQMDACLLACGSPSISTKTLHWCGCLLYGHKWTNGWIISQNTEILKFYFSTFPEIFRICDVISRLHLRWMCP